MKKYSNKILALALVVLLGIFALSKIFRSPRLESNVRKDLVKIDTALVTEVRIQPAKAAGEVVKLVREGYRWKLQEGPKEAKVEGGTVESMLGVLKDLQAQRMVALKKEKWDDFEVGENSTRVSVFADGEKEADFRVGKTGFSQAQGMAGAFTYIRLANEDEVYSTEGFIGPHFNRTFDEWRDKTFLRVAKDSVQRIEFNYPDSSFVLQKRDSLWYIGDRPASRPKVEGYLEKIRFKNLATFEDGFVPKGQPLLRINIVGRSGTLATAGAWPKGDGGWVLSSSFQDGVYFSGKAPGAVQDLFIGPGGLRE